MFSGTEILKEHFSLNFKIILLILSRTFSEKFIALRKVSPDQLNLSEAEHFRKR